MDHEQLRQIRRLLALVDRYGLAELVAEEDGLSVTIRGAAALAPAAPSPAVELSPVEAPIPMDGEVEVSSAEEEAPATMEEGLHALCSLMTGIFYRAPSPEARPYVEVGDQITEGQTVGLIEAMKVFSEIPADASGEIVRILAETGKLVTQGDVLMLIRPE